MPDSISDFFIDLGNYLATTVRRLPGFISALFTLGLAIATVIHRHPILVSWQVWLMLFEAALVFGGLLEWRASLQVPVEHSRQLKAVAKSVHDAIKAGEKVVYADGDRDDALLADDFRSHFPAWTADLDDWDKLYVDTPRDRTALHRVIAHSVANFPAEDGWDTRLIQSRTVEYLEKRALKPDIGPPPLYQPGTAVSWLPSGLLTPHRSPTPGREDRQLLLDWIERLASILEFDSYQKDVNHQRRIVSDLIPKLERVIHGPPIKRTLCPKDCEWRSQ
jgi:hypothetical protein